MPYRELQVLVRCNVCDAQATQPCAACNKPVCAKHRYSQAVATGLCRVCDEDYYAYQKSADRGGADMLVLLGTVCGALVLSLTWAAAAPFGVAAILLSLPVYAFVRPRRRRAAWLAGKRLRASARDQLLTAKLDAEAEAMTRLTERRRNASALD